MRLLLGRDGSGLLWCDGPLWLLHWWLLLLLVPLHLLHLDLVRRDRLMCRLQVLLHLLRLYYLLVLLGLIRLTLLLMKIRKLLDMLRAKWVSRSWDWRIRR